MKRPKVFSGMWRNEKGLSAMLVFLVLALFVGAPLVAVGLVGAGLFEIFFALLLLSGVMAVSSHTGLTVLVSILSLVTLGVRWTAFSGAPAGRIVLENALAGVALAVLAALVLEQVFREGPVTGYRIQGAIVVYLLLGLIFANVYEVIVRVVPDSFAFAHAEPANQSRGMVYFSFVTLTTVGYGDITAIHPFARSVAIAEALVGQLYPAILIARLVSLQIIARTEGKP